MAYLETPVSLGGLAGFIAGRPAARFSQLAPLYVVQTIARDFRYNETTTGTISDEVVVKVDGVETPFIGGRVWLFRLKDGSKVWEGSSDSDGRYNATGLVVGVKYVPVAIDLYGNLKAVAAGPVTAV